MYCECYHLVPCGKLIHNADVRTILADVRTMFADVRTILADVRHYNLQMLLFVLPA